MNHENQIKDYERRLQGMGDAIVEKDAAASKLRVEIDSLRLTNQRLEAEVERMKKLVAEAREKLDWVVVNGSGKLPPTHVNSVIVADNRLDEILHPHP